MWQTGEDPGDKIVDHINLNGLDNRWENLRLVTKSQNNANSPGHQRRKSDFKGVYAKGSKWIAQVRRNGVLHTVPGSFSSQKIAHMAREAFITKLEGL